MFESGKFQFWSPRLLSVVRIFLGLLYMQYGLSKYFGFPGPQPQNFQMFVTASVMSSIDSCTVCLAMYSKWT